MPRQQSVTKITSDIYHYKFNSWECFDVIDAIPLHQNILPKYILKSFRAQKLEFAKI